METGLRTSAYVIHIVTPSGVSRMDYSKTRRGWYVSDHVMSERGGVALGRGLLGFLKRIGIA